MVCVAALCARLTQGTSPRHLLRILSPRLTAPPAFTDVLLADILPTGYEVGVLAGRVAPGDTVAVVGAGPVGLAAIATARLFPF